MKNIIENDSKDDSKDDKCKDYHSQNVLSKLYSQSGTSLPVQAENSSIRQIMSLSTPPFIGKLLQILKESTYKNLIRWNEDGTSILIVDPINFSNIVLGEIFKHKNLNSFIRQLNKYRFSKKKTSTQLKLLYGEDVWEFVNPNFIKSKPELLFNIFRKSSKTKKFKRFNESIEFNSSLNNERVNVDSNLADSNPDKNLTSDQNIAHMFHNNVLGFTSKTNKLFDDMITEISNLKLLYKEMNGKQNRLQRMLLFSNGLPYYRILIIEENLTCSNHAYKSIQYYGFEPKILEYNPSKDLKEIFSKIDINLYELVLLSSDLLGVGTIINFIRSKNLQLPIILTSNSRVTSNDFFGKFKSVNGLLSKPYTSEQLYFGIKKALQHNNLKPNVMERFPGAPANVLAYVANNNIHSPNMYNNTNKISSSFLQVHSPLNQNNEKLANKFHYTLNSQNSNSPEMNTHQNLNENIKLNGVSSFNHFNNKKVSLSKSNVTNPPHK